MFMRYLARAGAVAAVSLVLTGCVTVPDSRPFNADRYQDIETIRLLPVPDNEPTVHIVNNPGYSFGLVGALIAEGTMSSRRSWFRDQVAEADLDHQALFVTAFEEAMRERGYRVVVPEPIVETESDKPPRNSWGTRKQYDSLTLDRSQAMLDMAMLFSGYAAPGAGSGSAYRPTVVVSARLLDEAGEEELFFDFVVYNDVFPVYSDGIVVFPDPDHAYDDFEALKAADSVTVDGYELALRAVARELAAQFPPRT